MLSISGHVHRTVTARKAARGGAAKERLSPRRRRAAPTATVYHCRAISSGRRAHDCWTTTEAALTADLSEDLRDAYERLRESASELGEQRIYASHHSIMFARRSCYCLRPAEAQSWNCASSSAARVDTPPVQRTASGPSTLKVAHLIDVRHHDEVRRADVESLRGPTHWPARPPEATLADRDQRLRRAGRSAGAATAAG